MIKGILWGYPNVKYASNNVSDLNANMLISRCSQVSSNFTNIEIGEVVWMNGHIGVYIGNGLVVESSIAWENGVQIANLNNIGGVGAKNGRTWTKHGKLPYVDYTKSNTVSTGNTNIATVQGEAAMYGLKVATQDTVKNGFWISRYATIYGGNSYGVKIPSSILNATTKYTCQQVKYDRGEYWVLAKEITSWVKVSECLVQ